MGVNHYKALLRLVFGLVHQSQEHGSKGVKFMGKTIKRKIYEIVTDVDKIKKETLEKALKNNAIREWAYIIHDKDTDDKGNYIRAHYHIAIRLKYAQELKHVAKWFEVQENFIELCKGTYQDLLKYLIHENCFDKYQYDVSDIVCNFDYQKVKNKKAGRERIEEIINGIVSGEIREYNYHEYIDAVEFDKYRKSIDNAFRYRADKLRTRLERGDTGMECIFITGPSGSGKTTYAKKLCCDNGYSVFISSSSNDILDGYAGQDAIILDDMRPSSIGLSDLLKMTDNHTASSVKSRYRNKVLECKMIIVTSILAIGEFYRNVLEVQKEPIVQLKRRFNVYIRLTKDKMVIQRFDKTIMDYGKQYITDNPVKDVINLNVMNEEETLNYLQELLGIEIRNDYDWVQGKLEDYDDFLEVI